VEARQPISYSGQGFSLRGEKSRFVLPPQFRKTVRESSLGHRTLCIAKHERWKCLTGFGLSRKDDLAAQIDREEMLAIQAGKDFDRDLRAAQLYGFSEVPFDDSGRFVIPDHLLNLAGVDGSLFFQAAGGFFTLWNPDELAQLGPGWEGAQAACANFVAEAGKGRR
jgi:MraZ protein